MSCLVSNAIDGFHISNENDVISWREHWLLGVNSSQTDDVITDATSFIWFRGVDGKHTEESGTDFFSFMILFCNSFLIYYLL